MTYFLRVLSFAAACGLLVSCDHFKQNKIFITAHVQTDQVEHPSEIMRIPIDGQEYIFKKVPEFSQRSLAAFEPFPAADGQGNGLVLQLDAAGTNYLEAASRLNQGMILLTMVDAQPVDMVELDQPITDGRFTIWRGVTDELVKEMDKFYPRISKMKSSSRWMPMLPSTDTERFKARRDALEADKAAERAKRDKERGIQRMPQSDRAIPMEGFKLPGT